MSQIERAGPGENGNRRRTLVTGASSGLGAALARRFAERGDEVWLVARRQNLLEQQAHAIRAAGGRAHVLALDLSDAKLTHERMRALDAEIGGMDLVIANAGFAGARAGIPISKMPWGDIHALVQTNLAGALASLMPFVAGMLARGRGQIVGISSISATLANPRTASYGASKAGLSYFLRAADMELRPRGVSVTVVEPGFMRTPAAEGIDEFMPFMQSTDKSVRIIERAIDARRRVLRFPWQLRLLTLLPRLLPWFIADRLIRASTSERAPQRASST